MNTFKGLMTFAQAVFVLAIFLFSTGLSGQTVKRSTDYYWSSNDWVYSTQKLYKYNINNTIDSTKSYSHNQYPDNMWKLNGYSTYDYFGSGTSKIVTDYYWNSTTELFEAKYKTSTTYTTGNRELQIIYSEGNNNSFENTSRYDYIYNTNLFLTQVKLYSWDVNWVNEGLFICSNDAAGNLTGYIYQELNDSTNNWDNISKGTFVYSGGNVVSETYETWEFGGWQPNYLTTFTYMPGSPGKIKSSLSKTYENNIWVNSSQEDYVYTSTYVVSTAQDWYSSTSTWVNTRRTVDEYVLEPNSIIEPKIRGFDLYPSPARDFVTLSGLENVKQLQLCDEKGSLLENHDVNGSMTRLDVSLLAPGVYIIRAEGQRVVKFMKE
jgi:hypothetical protein